MKITTLNLNDRIENQKERKSFSDKMLLVLLLVCQVFINTLFPFTFGYYFARTNSFIFLLLLIFSIIFSVQVEHKKDGEIKIKVLRNV